jgi:predicted dehydrogenase
MLSEPSAAAERSLRMAVIGCGPIGNLHAQAIAGSRHAVLVGVCDVDRERREATARRFGTAGYEHVGRLLEREQLRAVTIATPDHLHVDATLAALEAGCHVFCEKPLATTLGEAHRMAGAAADRGLHLGVDYNRRFAFGYRTAKRLHDQGSVGALQFALLRVTDRTPRAEVARNPYVIFTTLLTHHFDLMRWFGGEIRAVHAHGGGASTGDLLRSFVVSLEFAGSAIGTIIASYRDNQSRTSERMELGGNAGSIIVEDVMRRVIVAGLDPDETQVYAPNPFVGGDAFYNSLIEHLQAFIECVAEGRQPPVTGAEGLAGMVLAEAAIESLVRGTRIQVQS